MNAHTLAGIIFAGGFLVLGFSGGAAFLLSESAVARRHPSWAFVLIAIVAGSIGCIIIGGAKMDTAWASPAPAHSAATELTASLNRVGRPTSPSQERATISIAMTALDSRKNITLSPTPRGEGRFTVTLSGDSVKTCVIYNSNIAHWTWSRGACR